MLWIGVLDPLSSLGCGDEARLRRRFDYQHSTDAVWVPSRYEFRFQWVYFSSRGNSHIDFVFVVRNDSRRIHCLHLSWHSKCIHRCSQRVKLHQHLSISYCFATFIRVGTAGGGKLRTDWPTAPPFFHRTFCFSLLPFQAQYMLKHSARFVNKFCFICTPYTKRQARRVLPRSPHVTLHELRNTFE